MLKSKITGSMQEVILPDFSDDDNTTTVTKSRRVSFGTNIVKEFIVGSAVSAQCMLEYEQAFPSSDSSNADSSHSAIENGVLDQSTFAVPETQKVNKPAPSVSQTSEQDLVENKPKPTKFSSTICFSVDSPTADMEFTEGCITLAKSILDKKNKEMTVIIQAKPKDEEKVKDEETKYFDGSQFEMSMTRCLKSKENKREEKKCESEKTKIFSKFEDEMSITRCNKIFNYDESDSSFEDCKENQMPLDMIMRHLDKDSSDLENDLFNPEKTFSNLLSGNLLDVSNDSEKLNLNESMDITAEVQPNIFHNSIDKPNESFNESMEISCEFPSAVSEIVKEKESNPGAEKVSNASENSETAKPEKLLSNEFPSALEFTENELHFDTPLESEDKIIDEKLAELKGSDEVTNESMEVSEVLKESVNLPSFDEKITDQYLEVSTKKINESMDISSGLQPAQNESISKLKENELSMETIKEKIQQPVEVSLSVSQPPVETTSREPILQESLEMSADVQLKLPTELIESDTLEQSCEISTCEREPSLVDVKVIESLKEQSREPGCIWSLEEIQHPDTKSLGWLSFNCVLLESTVTICFYLRISKESSLNSCSSVSNSDIALKEEKQFKLSEYQLVIDFGFQELKKYFDQHRQKVETIRLIPYFLDRINLFTFKTNSYLRQIYSILTLYPGSSLTGPLLSFRLYSFPIFFSSLISIDLTNLFRLSNYSLSFVKDFGTFDENKIREIFEKCLKSENALCDFVIQSTKYLFELEKKTGYVSKRQHIKLLPADLKL